MANSYHAYRCWSCLLCHACNHTNFHCHLNSVYAIASGRLMHGAINLQDITFHSFKISTVASYSNTIIVLEFVYHTNS